MTLILQGTTKTKDLIIDYIEVQLSSGKTVSLRQKVLEMLFVQELTPLEISKRMHCSVKYVYDQKYLALQKLRRLLGGEPHGK